MTWMYFIRDKNAHWLKKKGGNSPIPLNSSWLDHHWHILFLNIWLKHDGIFWSEVNFHFCLYNFFSPTFHLQLGIGDCPSPNRSSSLVKELLAFFKKQTMITLSQNKHFCYLYLYLIFLPIKDVKITSNCKKSIIFSKYIYLHLINLLVPNLCLWNNPYYCNYVPRLV